MKQTTTREPVRIAVQSTAAGALLCLMACRARDIHAVLVPFEDVTTMVDALPARIDRDAVYRALGVGVMLREQDEALSPEWIRDRDDAHKRAEAAIRRLQKVLARRDLGHRTVSLERELRDVQDCGGNERERAELSPTTRGRPRALWREHAFALLRAAGTSIEAAEALLAAAGLAGPTPRRKSRRPR